MNGKLSEEKMVAFFCFKNRDLLKSYCNKRIRKVIINDNGWQKSSIHYEKRRNPHEPTRNINGKTAMAMKS